MRLDTGEIAVVLKAYAPDPYRPRVRVLFDADRQPLRDPQDVELWEGEDGETRSIQAPVDPSDYGMDPLIHL